MDELERYSAITSMRMGVLLLILGAGFGLDSFLRLGVAPKGWPLLFTVQALGFLGMYRKSCGRGSGFLVAGVYMACFSLLALYCNVTSWAHLSRLWPLFITFLGLAFLALFTFGGRMRRNLLVGLGLLSLSLVFLVVGTLGGQYWWTVLIFAGLSILASEVARR